MRTVLIAILCCAVVFASVVLIREGMALSEREDIAAKAQFQAEEIQARQKILDAEFDAGERRRNSHPRDCSLRGYPQIGMTKERLEETCWGRPRDINSTITAAGKMEQYVYWSGRRFVYLRNGIVTAIQDNN